jgi:hypothetical protein
VKKKMLLECCLRRGHKLETMEVLLLEIPFQGNKLWSKDSEILDDEMKGVVFVWWMVDGTLQVPV